MTRRRWIILHTVIILLIAYVSSYAYITRLRYEQYRQGGMFGFVYVSPESLSDDTESNWQIKDQLMAIFYWPLHHFDEVVFNAPPYVCIDRGIGPKKK